jgi:hypothetical protein
MHHNVSCVPGLTVFATGDMGSYCCGAAAAVLLLCIAERQLPDSKAV